MARLYLRRFTKTKLLTGFKTERLFSLSLVLCIAFCLLCFPYASYLRCDTPADGSPPSVTSGSRPAIVNALKPVYLPKTTNLEIVSDGSLKIKQVKLSKGGILRIEIFNATTSLPDSIAIDNGILRGAAFETAESELRIFISLTEPVIYEVESLPQGITVIFQNPVLEQLISLNVNDESLSTVMLMLFTQYGANIVAGSDVKGNVTAHLVDVPLKSALDEILKAEGYGYIKEGDLIRVMPAAKIEKEKAERAIPSPESIVPAKIEMESRVFELTYANVSDIQQVVQELVGTEGTFVTDKRTNSVIIFSSPELIERIASVLSQLDKEVEGEGIASANPRQAGASGSKQAEVVIPRVVKQVFKLQYTDPETASAILQPFLSEQGSIDIVKEKDKTQTGGGSGITSGGVGSAVGSGMQLGEGVGQGGYIVVSDIEEVLKRIEAEISIFDAPIPQIEIEAYIVEGALSDDNELGIDWTSVSEDEDMQFGFSSDYGGVITKGIITAEKFMGILNALSTRSDLRVLSNPRITTLEDQPSVFHSGDRIPYNRITIQDGIQQVETVFEDVGIVLAVTPQVKTNDMISLLLSTSVSSEAGFTPSGQPRISTRTTQSQVLVKSGDTVAIAGLISEKANTAISKVPILGDIPLIGRIFSTERDVKQRSEVTIFITPEIR